MDDIRENRFDRALILRDMVTSLATGGDLDNLSYRALRKEFVDDRRTKELLPQFVRTNFEGSGLWAYFKDYHTGTGAYAARRRHINEEFAALLDFLDGSGAPADGAVSAVLSRYDGEGVANVWDKALSRRESDPAGAITAARTLLEEVCKHILDDAGEAYQDKWDLPKLYTQVAKLMNLAPSQHTEEAFKRILGGCQSVVETIGGLRNKMSDAHGSGRRKVRPDKRHAALAVNLSGSMAMFLIETWISNRRGSTDVSDSNTNAGVQTEHKGVVLSSRYSLQSEIDDMKRIVDALTIDQAKKLEAIWCDSKANACYSVTVRQGAWSQDLKYAVGAAVTTACTGHNGIFFDGHAPGDAFIDPDWPESDFT